MPLKSNRKVALSLKDKLAGRWRKVDSLTYQENTARQVWLEGISFPLLLARQVFTNADESQGILYLVSSNTSALDYEGLTAIYQVTPFSPLLRSSTQSNRFIRGRLSVRVRPEQFFL